MRTTKWWEAIEVGCDSPPPKRHAVLGHRIVVKRKRVNE